MLQSKGLKEELSKRGLKVYGKHDELASRLATALRREGRMSPEQEGQRDAQLAELAMQQVRLVPSLAAADGCPVGAPQPERLVLIEGIIPG